MHASARWTIAALLAAAVLCVVVLAGCGGSGSAATTGGIAGVTTSSQTGLPIGVNLTFTGTGDISGTVYHATSSGVTGAYSVSTAMLPGVYTISAVDSGTLEGRAVEVPPGVTNQVTITAGKALAANLTIVVPPAGP